MKDPPKVLIVDDEPQVRNALTRLVRGKKMQAAVAASAEEALALAQHEEFASILTDVRMPGMGGLALLQNMSPLQPGARFIVLTGAGPVDPALLPRGHGVQVFRKPWQDGELAEALAGAYEERRPSALPPPLSAPRARRVLLVEDCEVDAALFKTALSKRSPRAYQVTTVRNFAEAKQVLRTESYDVSCLDLGLPDANGLEVIARIQAEAPELGFVVLSGVDDEELALRAVQSGAQDYLVKGKADGASIVKALRYAEERKRVELRLSKMALYDQLTGLPNRTLFRQRVAQSLARSRRNRSAFAVLLLDLDRFKAINDGLGHDAGDSFLQIVADRLRNATRATDTVARLGGDEFAVLAEPIEEQLDVIRVIQRINETLNETAELNSTRLVPTASVGAAVFPDSGEDSDSLLAAADAAMYAAKAKGRNTFHIYGKELQNDAAEKLALEGDVRAAVDNNEFTLMYQPQIGVRDRFLGTEALLRWEKPGHGVVPADQFIGVLEYTGLITKLGPWIFDTAFAQFRRWLDAGLAIDRIAVNVSARQFADKELPSIIRECTKRHGLCPKQIELELTESTFLQNTAEVQAALGSLRDDGYRIALDDFGTGYASLAYLENFPITTVKIDRSFTREVTTVAYRRRLVAGIVSLATHLGFDVVAEGVETLAQQDVLVAEHCSVLQGYLFGRAVSGSKFFEQFQQARTA